MEWKTTTRMLDDLREFEDEAWGCFVERFRGPIAHFARKSGLPGSEAEDIAQEVLLAFAQAQRSGGFEKGRGRLSTFLFGIARNKVVDCLRSRQRENAHRQTVGGRQTFFAQVEDPEASRKSWDESWREETLRQCFRQVRREFRESSWRAFEEVCVKQRPIPEVAEELGLTRNAISVAKHRIAKRIRELEEEFEGTLA